MPHNHDDAKPYPAAIDYYERSLKSQPANASVRTDLGTAYWYNGKLDAAISEFNEALTYQPNKPDTLFNLGIVKWQGKKDTDGAIAAWENCSQPIQTTKAGKRFRA